MIKAVIFDMFETLVTHFESPVYMAKQISSDIGIREGEFREIWDTSDNDGTLGKRSFEENTPRICCQKVIKLIIFALKKSLLRLLLKIILVWEKDKCS